MNLKLVSMFLTQFVILGLLAGVSSIPAQCLHWAKVYPDCPCIPALDKNGAELPSVAVVDCSSKNFTSVPQKKADFPLTLYELRLRNNQITTLPSNAFQGVKIRHLDLTGNSVGVIANDAFSGLEDDLLVLELEGDSVTQPQINAMSKLVYLEELTMTNYHFAHLTGSPEHGYFNPFRHLIHLTLDNWGIESIEPHAFINSAKSPTIRRLSLLNQKLTSLPVDVLHEPELKHLEMLQISHTQISRISPYAFSDLHHVKEIILSDNAIGTIESNSFKNVGDTLEKIDLSNNFLGAAGGNDLPHLKDLYELKELILHNNELVSVPTMDNIGSGQPFKLDLSNNKIDKLSANGLTHFGQRLQSLDLSDNRIVEIDSQIFSGAALLQSLVLKNQIGVSTTALKVPTSLTQAADSLIYLDFSGQKVDQQSLWQALTKLGKLETLILHSVELTSIPDFAFKNLAHLTTLELSFNSIKQITDRTFVGPRGLKKLNLKSNAFVNLPSCLFYKYNADSLSLNMGYNRIACGCTIKTLLEKYRMGLITFPDAISVPLCSDGTPMTSKDPQQLFCNPLRCTDYYTATPSTTPGLPQTTDANKTPKINIRVQEDGTNSLKIGWDISNTDGLQYYKVDVSSVYTTKDFDASRVDNGQPNIRGMKPKSHLTDVCVHAFYDTAVPVSLCQSVETNTEPTSQPSGNLDPSTS